MPMLTGPMIKLTVRHLLEKKIRFALTTLTVVLGVMFVVGSFVLTDSLRAVFTDLADDIASGVDLTVRTKQEVGGDFDRAHPARLSRNRGGRCGRRAGDIPVCGGVQRGDRRRRRGAHSAVGATVPRLQLHEQPALPDRWQRGTREAGRVRRRHHHSHRQRPAHRRDLRDQRSGLLGNGSSWSARSISAPPKPTTA